MSRNLRWPNHPGLQGIWAETINCSIKEADHNLAFFEKMLPMFWTDRETSESIKKTLNNLYDKKTHYLNCLKHGDYV